MSQANQGGVTRRDVIKQTGKVVAASALAGVAIPSVHAGETNTIQVALIGCGGRGTGAAENALKTIDQGPINLVAMGDVFADRLASSHRFLSKTFPQQCQVPQERQFVGFDSAKKAMDSLKKGDVAIFATPPAFRWPFFEYAIQKGLHVFMEKPTTVDGPSTRRMFKLADDSEKLNLKVGVGLMCRHCDARAELYKRIKDGELGDLVLLRAYRMVGPTGSAFTGPKPANMNELEYQIRRFHAFLWLSGGAFSDFLVHNIDECCWMKDAWPVRAWASGGRTYRGDNVDQNFDTYSVEYTYPDGTKLFLEGRNMTGCKQEFASYAQGSKGLAVISQSGHTPAGCRIYKGHNMANDQIAWRYGTKEPNPYQREWDHLIDAIRKDKPFNEAKRGAEASLVTAMGRMAAHTGQAITRDQMLSCEHEFAPEVGNLTANSAAPLLLDKNGKYPIPQPGIKRDREY